MKGYRNGVTVILAAVAWMLLMGAWPARAASVSVPVPDGCVLQLAGNVLSCVGAPTPPPVVTPPPVTPPPVGIPAKIGGLSVKQTGPLPLYTRIAVGSLKGEALVIAYAGGNGVVQLYEYGGPPLKRSYWVTTNLNATPVWKAGGTGVFVILKPGEFLVAKNTTAGQGTASAVEAQ